jgi:formylglycine-generating enzyme required for sulfatase activity
VHDVFVDAFYIDKYEVTNAELEACVRDDVCKPHTETTAPGIFGYFGVDFYDNYPAIYVSWEAAVEYCEWREARLPTEAEWEKAARWDPATGETYLYPWGNAFPNPDFANYYDSGIGRAVEVDSYPGGASPVGAVNMAGNVLEWVADWYDADYYEVSPAENPTGPETGQLKVLRGASFDVTSGGVIPTTRWQQTPNFTSVDFGFRCALTPEG